MSSISSLSVTAIAEELGARLKRARLNRNLTQQEVADAAGMSRKTVINAENGRAQLESFIAILTALELTEQLNQFLPEQPMSPVQLLKLKGKERQRASGTRASQEGDAEGEPEW